MTAQTNAQRQAVSQARRIAAYNALKAAAMEVGYMAHERDGEGFDRLIHDLEAGNVSLQIGDEK